MKFALTLLLAGAVVYGCLSLILYLTQRSMLYYPTPENTSANAEALLLDSGGERIKVWKIPGNGDRALIYFGGNAEDVAHNLVDYANWFPERTVYLVNYRGYGGSTGSPTEAGFYADALTVYDAVAAESGGIAVIGRSLGSGVATYVAANRPVEKLVLVTPFDSIVAVAQKLYPLFPVSLLMQDRYDSLGRAAEIGCPVLIVLAGEDTVVPPEHGRKLAQGFPEAQVEIVEIAPADHIDVGTYPEYRERLIAFL